MKKGDRMKISQKQAHVLFAVIMVGTLTFILTGATSFINSNCTLQLSKWIHNWIMAYIIALPTMMVLSPPLRKSLAKYTAN